MEKFIKEFDLIRRNPIYFIEKYYNLVNDNKLELSDDEKQRLYDKYKMIPLFKMDDSMSKYFDRIDELKAKGYKDWEIL